MFPYRFPPIRHCESNTQNQTQTRCYVKLVHDFWTLLFSAFRSSIIDHMEELVSGLQGPPGIPGRGRPGRPGPPGRTGQQGSCMNDRFYYPMLGCFDF